MPQPLARSMSTVLSQILRSTHQSRRSCSTLLFQPHTRNNRSQLGRQQHSSIVLHKSKGFSTSSAVQFWTSNVSHSKEIQVPVPWGHLGGIEWGPSDGLPLLGLHGWQDNAGTFDTLAPLITDNYRFIALDMPGHGRSSHLPKGMFYSIVHYLMAVKRAAAHFGWDKFDIVGHSMGANIGLAYAAAYPEEISRCVTLDLLYPWLTPLKKHTKEMRKGIGKLLKWEEQSDTPPVHTIEEAESRALTATYEQLTPESARILLRRGTVKSPDGKGVSFSRDRRVQIVTIPLTTEEQLMELFSHLRCELLAVRATGVEGGPSTPFYPQAKENEFREFYRSHCSYFEYVLTPGTHFVHLIEPEKVAPVVTKFLNRPRVAKPHEHDKEASAQ